MAENESLDLFRKGSNRWRVLRDLIKKHASDERIVDKLRRNLYKSFASIIKNNQIDVARLIDAATGQLEMRDVLRDCRGHEYAQLFALQAGQELDRVSVVENVLHTVADRYLDQIQLDLAGSAKYPTAESFQTDRRAWKREVYDSIRELATNIAANPSAPPRLPRQTGEQRQTEHRELLGVSILASRRGK